MKDLRKLFGTDGIRGKAETDLTPEFILRVGQAGAKFLSGENCVENYLKSSAKNAKVKILIGRDTRPSGKKISEVLVSAILENGFDVLDGRIITTPAAALLVKILGLDGAIVVSASHNPVEDNGIKFFGRGGKKLTDSQEHSIEYCILNEPDQVPERGEVHGRNKETDVHDQAGKTRGNYSVLEDAYEIYINYIRDFFNLDLSGIRIAIDCANGAASILAPMVFKQFKADIEVFNSDISGLLINKDCGATHPEFISRATVESRSDLGIAFDGDADRVIICDRRGRIIDGDIIIGFCAIDMAEKKTLANNSIVTTVMANMGLEKVMKENGITVHRTQVGDRYVLEKMAETGSVLGGEQSGHIIFTNISPTGDGILSALEFLNVIVSNNYNFSEITEIIPKYPQILKNIRVADKKRVLESEMLIEAVKKVTNRLNGAGRLLVRPSGTEPLIRVMAEAESEKLAAGAVEEILSVIKEINLEQP